MLKFKLAIFFIASLLFSIVVAPTPSLAGSCECSTTFEAEGQTYNTNACLDQKTAADCQNNTSYTSCTYQDFSCLNVIDKTCQAATDCQIAPCQTGHAECRQGVCFVDNTLKQCWNNTNAGFGQTIEFKPPTLEIKIPGVKFPTEKPQVDNEGFLSISYLADYLKAIYKFLVIAASVVAAIVIILNGFRITMSAGGEEKGEGIKRVGQAVIGLFIMWSSYAILYTVNPALTQLQPIRVKYIVPEQPITPEEEDPFGDNLPAVSITSSTEDTQELGAEARITLAQGVQVTDDLAVKIAEAAKTITDPSVSFLITSGYRSVEKQTAEIKKHCKNPPGSKTCDPIDGVQVCMLKNGPKSCPHTTGRAVDIWGSKDDGASQCLRRATCLSNLDACRKNPCQAAVIAAMRSAGFCNLASEPWHFENPKMSTTCN